MVGGVRVVPYGTVWTDLTYASSRTVPGRFTLWIASEEEQGEAAIELDARRSRMGAYVHGPELDGCLFDGCLPEWLVGSGPKSSTMETGARFEVDFLGNFTTDNQPDVRLRHVYFEAKNDRARFLAGQYWDVVSPLLPNTVHFPVLWGAGNVGFRRNQFRLERFIDLGKGRVWTVQAAVAQNVIQDLTTGFSSVGVNRETGDWPMIQARTAMRFDDISAAGRSLQIGLSGHIGETGFDFTEGHPANPALGPEDDVRLTTWSANAEIVVPLSERWSVQGECFTGSNMSNLLGGIVQGVCPCLRVPIRSTGGWGEVTYAWSPKVSLHAGASIDDPNDNDSLIGRTKNQVVYANVIYRASDQLTTGIEVSSWRTEYHNRTDEPGFTFVDSPTAPGEAVLFDWTVRYSF